MDGVLNSHVNRMLLDKIHPSTYSGSRVAEPLRVLRRIENVDLTISAHQ